MSAAELEIHRKWLLTKEVLAHGKAETITNKQGLKLQTYTWRADNPKGTMVLCHGHGAYAIFDYNGYSGDPRVPKPYKGGWIETMVNAGYNVATMDYQSMGLSEGLRGLRAYVESFEDYVDDLLQFTRGLDSQPGFEGLPKFVVACSLGGCIAVHAAHKAPGDHFAGLALLAPMLSLERVAQKGMNKVLRPLGELLSGLVPAAKVASTSRNTMFPDLQRLFDEDPMTYVDKTRARVAVEYLKATAWAVKEMHRMDFPFITIHSEVDDMVDPASSKMLYSRSAAKDKTLWLVNSFWHILTKEKGNEVILAKVLEWAGARTTKGGDRPAFGSLAPRTPHPAEPRQILAVQ